MSKLFVKLTHDYCDHPKIVRLSNEAFRLHIELIVYAARFLTDGVIPNRVANRLANQLANPVENRLGFDPLTELLTNDPEHPSLIKLSTGDYELHGYTDINESRASVKAKKARNSANGRRGGRPRKTQSKTESVTESQTHSLTESGTESRVDNRYIDIKKEVSKDTSKKTKGTRLSEQWQPKPQLIEQMQKECPHVNLETETRIFTDYWLSVPGQKGVKLDWDRTWRNWIRRKAEQAPRLRPVAKPAQPDAVAYLKALESQHAS